MAGMLDLLPQVEEIWRSEPQKLIDAADSVVLALEEGNAGVVPVAAPLPSGKRPE